LKQILNVTWTSPEIDCRAGTDDDIWNQGAIPGQLYGPHLSCWLANIVPDIMLRFWLHLSLGWKIRRLQQETCHDYHGETGHAF